MTDERGDRPHSPQQPAGPQPPQGPPPGYPARPAPYGGPQAPARGPSGPRANFGQRLGAYLLDALIVGGIGTAAFLIVFFLIVAIQGGNEEPGPVAGVILFLLSLAVTAWSWGYFIYFEGGPTGQTWGKRALSIRVIHSHTGQPIGYGKATVRVLARILSGLACYLGFLWMLWDERQETWHDKLSDTIVVPTSAYPVAQ